MFVVKPTLRRHARDIFHHPMNAAKKAVVSVSPTPPPVPEPPKADYVTPSVIGAVTAALSYVLVKQLVRPEEEIVRPLDGPASDREYRMALARTRQAVHIQKAVVHARHRDLARTVVELELALTENSICREAVLVSNFEAEEMLELYRIAVENMSAKLPPNYGLLLQLQNMLDIPADKAKEVEKRALEQAGSFSI